MPTDLHVADTIVARILLDLPACIYKLNWTTIELSQMMSGTHTLVTFFGYALELLPISMSTGCETMTIRTG